MRKFIVIGDSFVMSPSKEHDINSRHVLSTWTKLLKDNISNFDVIIDGQPSRDVQTIIDKWTISLPYLNEDDILIICLPTFYRTRLPLKKDKWYGYEYENYKFINKFVGANSYQQGDDTIDSFNHSNYTLKEEFITMYQILNSTESSYTNYMDIIDSLFKITPCNLYVFTWDSLNYENDKIEDRKILETKLNFWGTLHDEYVDSDGERGILGDLHWNEKMNRMFYDYLLNDKLKNIL